MEGAGRIGLAPCTTVTCLGTHQVSFFTELGTAIMTMYESDWRVYKLIQFQKLLMPRGEPSAASRGRLSLADAIVKMKEISLSCTFFLAGQVSKKPNMPG